MKSVRKAWTIKVNQPRITATTTFKEYYNPDLNKKCLDKLPSIIGYTLGQYRDLFRLSNSKLVSTYNVNTTKWFTPRDDDWED